MKRLRLLLLLPSVLSLALAKTAPADQKENTVGPETGDKPQLPANPLDAPLRWVGNEKTDASADGGLRLAVGVQNIQIFRANHTVSEHGDGLLHSYNHAPMLAYWKGRFWLEFLSANRDEHEPPCPTSLMSSADGLHWSAPHVAFPVITLPDGSPSVSHQRMGFFVAPSGRLLVLSFYGKHPSPNDGSGLGRAVREVHEDGSLGPVFFLRLNTHAGWTEDKVPFPMYSKSSDKGFVEACEALLGNWLIRNQMWEEDESTDGFYSIMGRAMSFAHRPDGKVIGVWKNALVSLSSDEGKTWTTKVFAPGIPANASKYWIQGTHDGRFVLAFNPTTRLRNPLVVATSADGIEFSKLLTIHGELPDQRFGGAFKNLGPQYVRGIVEGNGTPPDGALWLCYSVNKEDIWIARVPVPIRDRVEQPVNDNFEGALVGSLPAEWNSYSPEWAPVRIVDSGTSQGKALELRDEEPTDYARAIRVFPEAHGLKLSFKVLARQNTARLDVELQTAAGARPVRLSFDVDGHLWVDHEGQWQDAGAYEAGKWQQIEITIPKKADSDRYEFKWNGQKPLRRDVVFAEPALSMERLSFRTGAYRARGEGGRDIPGGDKKVPAASFLVDDVVVTPDN